MRIPVYLTCTTLQDSAGVDYCFRERRLSRQSECDKVLAIVDAPKGSRVRHRRDEHGTEQLVVPCPTSFWGWLFRHAEVISAKYVVNCARHRQYGLSLISWELPAQDSEATVAPPAAGLRALNV